jgi:hypothetical protein
VRVCGPGVVEAARVVMAAALWREVAAEVGGLGRDDTLRPRRGGGVVSDDRTRQEAGQCRF